jgi:hypothetical protein
VSVVLVLASCATSHPRPVSDTGPGTDARIGVDTPGDRVDAAACFAELCDGDDQDCDGAVDEDALCELSGATSTCIDGVCALGACDEGWADCDGNAGTGCETEIDTDRVNCGGCGVECGLTERCDVGVCARERILDVATGTSLTCVLLESERVLCWGLVDRLDRDGVRVDGPRRPFSAASATPFEVDGMPAGVTRIVAMPRAVLALTRSGEVWGWGANDLGQLGIGTTSFAVERPVRTLLPERITALGSSDLRGTAIAGRIAYTWGYRGPSSDPMPTPVEFPLRITAAVSTRAGHAVVLEDGSAWTFGVLGRGLRPGEGDSGDWTWRSPEPLGLPGLAVEVSCGGPGTTCCVSLDEGTVACWGTNLQGQLGNGAFATTIDQVYPPALVAGLEAVRGLAVVGGTVFPRGDEVGSGRTGVYAFNADGVVAWGSRQVTRLSADETRPRALTSEPGPVTGVFGRSESGQVCLRIGETQLRCWGGNWAGELGIEAAGPPVDELVAPIGFE